MKGGKVVAQGSSGCVFDPALLCEGQTHRQEGYVTKMLGTGDYGEYDSEWREIQKIKPIIEGIPNNENYFIVTQIYPCINPKYDTTRDLINFNSKNCLALTERISPSRPGETRDDIQDIALLKSATAQGFIQGLNMPNGGPNMLEYTKPVDFSVEQFKTMNNLVIELLINGVVPMNKAGLLHLDIKAPNMVFNGSHVRLIDWGLASKINADVGFGLESEMNPPIMVNRPFTNILFAYKKGKSILGEWINLIINKNQKSGIFNRKSKEQIASIIKEYLRLRDGDVKGVLYNDKMMQRVLGSRILFHLPYIAHVAFENNIDKTLDLIASQIAYAVVEQCYNPVTKKMSVFDVKRYFLEVYQHNVDVFGLVSFYLTFLTNSHKNIFKTTYIGRVLDTILTKYLYSETSAAKRYNIDEIVAELRYLNSNQVLYPILKGELEPEPPIVRAPQNTPVQIPTIVDEKLLGGKKRKRKTKKGKTKKGKTKKGKRKK